MAVRQRRRNTMNPHCRADTRCVPLHDDGAPGWWSFRRIPSMVSSPSIDDEDEGCERNDDEGGDDDNDVDDTAI